MLRQKSRAKRKKGALMMILRLKPIKRLWRWMMWRSSNQFTWKISGELEKFSNTELNTNSDHRSVPTITNAANTS